MIHIEKYNRLQSILNTMCIPELRKNDLVWLDKNMGVRNSDHPQYEEALKLLKELMIANGDI